MKRKNKDPNSPEAIEAVVRRMRGMSREEWQELVTELSVPPEGVEETWRNYDLFHANRASAPGCGQNEATDAPDSSRRRTRRKRLEPNSPEAVEAIIRRIESMTKEDRHRLIEELSHAPEGVYDPWSEENWPQERELLQSSDGAAPAADPCPLTERERAAGSD
jgi:hypothetical protein